MHSPNSNAVKDENMKVLYVVALATLLFAGCATPPGYYQPHFYKEFSIEVKENDLSNPRPQVVATFKITN